MIILFWTKFVNDLTLFKHEIIQEIFLQISLIYFFVRVIWITKQHFHYVYAKNKKELYSFFGSLLFYMINNNLLKYFAYKLEDDLIEDGTY